MIGRTYLLRGEPVVVLVRADWKAGGPRNVLVQHADGSRLVRPFRGLRRNPGANPSDAFLSVREFLDRMIEPRQLKLTRAADER